VLQGATVSVLNNSVCENMFRSAGYIKKIPDTFICAGSKDGGYDACKVSAYMPTTMQLVFSHICPVGTNNKLNIIW